LGADSIRFELNKHVHQVGLSVWSVVGVLRLREDRQRGKFGLVGRKGKELGRSMVSKWSLVDCMHWITSVSLFNLG